MSTNPATPAQTAHVPPSASRSASTSQVDPFALLELLPNAVLCMDGDFRFTYANAAARRLSRLPESALNGPTHWVLYPETIGTPIETIYREVLADGIPRQIQHFYEPFQVWIDISIQRFESGLLLHYADITERKRLQAERDATTILVRKVFEAMPDGVVTIDRNWTFTYANRRALELIDPENRLLGKNLWDEFPAAASTPVWDAYHRSMNEGVTASAEIYYAEPINAWLALQSQPIEDGIVVFFRNITAQKADEQLVARQQELLALVQRNARLATWEVDLISRNIVFGVGSHPVYGHPLDSISTFESFLRIVHPDHLAHIREIIAAALANHSSFIVDYQVLNSAGEPIWIESRGNATYLDNKATHITGISLDITERKQSEEVMLRQRQLLDEVQQTAKVATWEIDLTTGALSFGPGSFSVYGHPLEQLNSIPAFREVVAPAHRALVRASFERAISTMLPLSSEFEVIDSQGQIVWIESRAQAIAVDGVPRFVRGIAFDVTARKRNEAILVASEQRYRVLADLNPQALWSADPSGVLTYANQGFLDYLGVTISDLTGAGLIGFDPRDLDHVTAVWNQSIATGVDYNVEARLCRASDQTYRWWSLRALPVRDDSGAIISWLGVGQDIHDLKTAAEALRAEQQETERKRLELETVYRTAPIGLSLIDPVDFRFLRINEREAELLGRPEHEVVGRTVAEIAPMPGLLDLFRQAANGVPVKDHLVEGELPLRPGDRRSWTVNYLPVYGPSGKIEAISTAAMDVTNQRRSEAALIQSEKLAAVGRLASSISHEINNPLEAVTNLLYLVAASTDLSAENKLYVRMAQSELSRVSQIATQTLRFHRQAVAPTSVTAAELVGAVLNLYQGRLGNSNIRISTRYDTDVRILCFENDIRQVLNNLIANAIDAMRFGGRLLLRAHNAHDSSGEPGVRIIVADTGHGMSPATLARIFEPFFTTKDLNGTGLGLWISQGIVQRHGGRLDVRSSTHPTYHGTIFCLFLPLKQLES